MHGRVALVPSNRSLVARLLPLQQQVADANCCTVNNMYFLETRIDIT